MLRMHQIEQLLIIVCMYLFYNFLLVLLLLLLCEMFRNQCQRVGGP